MDDLMDNYFVYVNKRHQFTHFFWPAWNKIGRLFNFIKIVFDWSFKTNCVYLFDLQVRNFVLIRQQFTS